MKGKPFRGGFPKKSKQSSKQVEINFFLIDQYKVGIQIPFGYCIQQIKNYIRSVGQGVWDQNDKCWVINRQAYQKVVQKLQDHFFNLNNNQQKNEKIIKVNAIDDFVLKAQKILRQDLSQLIITNLKPYTNVHLRYNQIQTKIEPQSLPFYKKLFDFQKQSLRFGIRKHGRMLLADEMGVGKTIQSLAVAYIYKHQWPLLIICPPTLKINWQNQIKRWYADIQPHNIQLVNSSKTVFRVNVKIMIISYDLAWRMKQMFDHVKIVIADQAHYLKSADSKRSQILVPFLSTRKRVILLTGTPAFARPKQIFNLISIVRPNLFKNFKSFGNRYCQPKWNHWSRAYEYNGCKNVKQLHYILKQNIMIRRLKCEVLTQLPDKNRQKVVLQSDPSIVKNIKEVLQKNNISKIQTFFSQFIGTSSVTEQGQDKRQQIMQAYRLSGMAKIKAVKQYISEILENNIKLLVFAHHIKVLDEIESELKNKKIKFMRIDGTVSMVERANNVEKFQNDPEILVALLSITAASVGLTLTAASTVIFAQLHWTPALMIQAQDRAHRVGQKDSVNCHYLIGQNTLDQMLYTFLQKKVLNVSSFIDGEKKDLQFQQLRKGQKGKFSKKQENSFMFGKKTNFGSNLLQRDFQDIENDQQNNPSPKSQLTDISQSSLGDSYIPSKKRPPTGTLDAFIGSRKSHSSRMIKQITQLSQLKERQPQNQRQYEYQQKFQARTSAMFKDNWQEQQPIKTQVPRSNKQRSYQLDSDDQFQKALQIYVKSRQPSNSNNSNTKKDLDSSRTQSLKQKNPSTSKSIQKQKNINLQQNSSNITSSNSKTQSVEIRPQQKQWQI